MEWNRAKRLMAAVLLLLNLVLLGVLGYTHYTRHKEERAAVQSAVQALASAGVELDAALVPAETGERQMLLVQRDTAAEDACSAALLPEGVNAVEGGVRYRSCDEESVIWRAGAVLEAVLTENAPIDSLLESAGISGIQETENGEDILMQQLDGLPIFNSRLCIRTDGATVGISGRWCLGEPQLLSTDTEQALPGLLLCFVREVTELPAEILALDAGYIARPVAGVGVQLIPAWKITGDSGTWYISAMDGSLLTGD